jgi:LPS export ABC transporter protein LptC
MTFGQVRWIKRTLLLSFVAVGFYVGRYVWEGVRARKAAPAEKIEEPQSPVSREVAIEQLDSEGRTAWTLKAAESIGRTESAQQFRDVEIRFDAGEEKVPVVVTADHCEIQKDSSVFLEGNVVVRDDTSLRLEANTLRFERQPDRAWSTEPVRYFRKGLTGTAGSLRYGLEDGALELENGVEAVFREEGDAPLRIESERASMRRRRHFVQFVDEVRVRQTNRTLDCNDLQVYLDGENEYVERLEAYEEVDLRMDVAEGEVSETTSSNVSSEAGTKRLLTEKLEAFFRPGGGELERVRALQGGRLLMTLPQGAREGYDKDLEGYTLIFEFDEAGSLQVLRGRGGVTLVLTPRVSGEEKKIVNSRQLEAFFDPASGDLREAVCEKAVTFEQGEVRAEAEKGTFHNLESKLVLEEEPRLWDRKASLEARVIEIDVGSGDVEGKGSVRSTSRDSSASANLFPSESEEAVTFVSERVRYTRATDTAVYTGGARGIQGENRIEANRIRLLQGQGELSAENAVRTSFLQKPKSGEPELMVTDAKTFLYRTKEETLRYGGGVSMRSKEMTLKGATVDVLLEPGAREVREIRAEGEVSVETPEGKAAGDHAKYLPEEGSMTVHGENARLENAGKLTEGKQLTFFLDDDRILVDGREQARTKTTYSSKPRL